MDDERLEADLAAVEAEFEALTKGLNLRGQNRAKLFAIARFGLALRLELGDEPQLVIDVAALAITDAVIAKREAREKAVAA